MSVEAIGMVLNHSRAKGTERLVLFGIANHLGDGGAWPSIATLARYALVTERNVQRAISRLVDLGEVVVHVQGGGLRDMPSWKRPNRYEIALACPPSCDRSMNHRPRPLPTAPADLWIEGVAAAPGGGGSATGGVAAAPPGGVAAAPPEPSLEPSLERDQGPASVTGPRASSTPPPAERLSEARERIQQARRLAGSHTR